MGLFAHIKNWFGRPLNPNADPVNLGLYIGLIILFIFLWNTVLLQIGRIGKAIVE